MTDSLFSNSPIYEPLASKLRPKNLDEYVGQQHILGQGKPLRQAVENSTLHSMILWGPPGVGKTTLAKILSHYVNAKFISISAVMSGVKEIRESIEQAKMAQAQHRLTVLFVDEVHRFNKSQQDAFLPWIEDGTIIFIGATTENPAFELNNALLSRCRVYRLESLSNDQLELLLDRTLAPGILSIDKSFKLTDSAKNLLISAADGDARRLLGFMETAADFCSDDEIIDTAAVEMVIGGSYRRFDKGGDNFYEQISALHKAVRGSSPDASLYWLARMLDGGCDPLYLARRIVRMASEDIGNADPRALSLCIDAWQTVERLGQPEGDLALAQAVSYLACAPKSNAVYLAYKAAISLVNNSPSHPVPMHLRNAPTKLHKEQGCAAEYRYAHDEPNAFAAGENYFPEELKNTQLYYPVDRGLESAIKAKLENFAQLNNTSKLKRYD